MVMDVGKTNVRLFQDEAGKLMNSRQPLKGEKAAEDAKKTGTVSDRVSLGREKTEEVTYDASIKDAVEARYALLRDLVTKTLQEQGVASKVATGDREIDIASLTPEQAQELVSDDGYFGVEQTSERMFQFAIQMAGTDPARMAEVRKGLEKGFEEAKKAFGNWLPDISYDTMDALMEKLQKYEEENGMTVSDKSGPWTR